MWNWFDGNYQPVKLTEEFVAGGKHKRKHWNGQRVLSFCRLSDYNIPPYFSMELLAD